MTIYKEEDPSICLLYMLFYFIKYILKDYKFHEKLGKGSSGLVYKAEKLEVKNKINNSPSFQNENNIQPTKSSKSESMFFVECAIKIIKMDKEKLFDRLKFEIAIMKMCRHENIVQYYETYKHLQ